MSDVCWAVAKRLDRGLELVKGNGAVAILHVACYGPRQQREKMRYLVEEFEEVLEAVKSVRAHRRHRVAKHGLLRMQRLNR